ncbi:MULTISPECIES: type I restriction-modification system subunit M [Acinetobacter calcoaceticus/baumannii complex]|uniref:type I restriction-modification system subunit M n=1 Tax=Acinetobacter calcoaceticus/baumannii complex TaxID=909768 RepID=UPI00148C3814|nr:MULTISPECIES: type I restriction-modification system subunit M [Acinetobacter calcoaceticus/baumannii complex]MBR8588598.1 N-6 DNA methylase [Acinetobacter baumannii]MCO9044956.1 type I restriction-modification system subunit M [Acinetobacter baumannii]MCO9052307.1 type I restriction-modification system subunit M [Acinetobacter baumannii]MCO9055725.1 type I restriction-modification system subunit M [Acinetobacter baumannii]MCO9059654.1 type I restriction-modification system subunit M [Acine
MNISLIEKDLWEAADDLRANSKLTATEYAQPILGIIFLSHATSRFYSLKKELLKDHQMASYQKLVDENKMPAEAFEKQLEIAFKARSALYLNPEQRFDYLANLPTGHNLGAELDAIMESIETQNPVLKGILPKTYQHFEEDLLERVVRIFNRDTLLNAEGDVFGKIYEYFLNKFAQSGAQEGGEFFTPPSLVRTIVNFIEPDHGLVIDPAVGSAGMFIQTTHFQEQNHTHNQMQFVGQEKTKNNQKLAIMNMVVHGLDASNIVEGNSFYSALSDYIGQCDFVMANPPFNVDAVDASKCKNDVYVIPQHEKGKPEPKALEIVQAAIAEKKRLPFGLPGVTSKSGGKRNDGNDAKNEQVSNANSLWIQYFYSYLNESGRAGFVMPSSASDAGGRDKEIRQKLVETGHVDIMVSIGPKFFYTRSLPCALWFFDKSKTESRKDKVLMLDARNIFTVVSAKSHIFSESQLEALNAIVWLYREEHNKYQNLLRRYINTMLETIEQMRAVYKDYLRSSKSVVDYVAKFASNTSIDILNKLSKKEQEAEDKPTPITTEQLSLLKASALKAQQGLDSELVEEEKIALLDALPNVEKLRQKLNDAQDHAAIIVIFTTLQNTQNQTQAVFNKLNTTKSEALALVAQADSLYAKKDKKRWANKEVVALLRDLNTSAEGEPETIQDQVQCLEKALVDCIANITWLYECFPEGVYADVAGLCKLASQEDIKAQDYSLTPGRYVGIEEISSINKNVVEEVLRLLVEINELNQSSQILHNKLTLNLKELF